MQHARRSAAAMSRMDAVGLLASAAILTAACICVAGVHAADSCLAESDFSWDLDGWEVEGEGARDLAHMSKMITAGDDGASTWYFVAPHKFTGSKRDAYGGHLSFRHGFFEFNSNGKDIMGSAFDVLITSESYGLSVGRRAVFPAYSFSSEHKLELHEAAGWLHAETNQPPSRPEMLRLLSKISSIKIRGGIYEGSEAAYIMDVKLVAGPEQQSSEHRTSLKAQSIRTDL